MTVWTSRAIRRCFVDYFKLKHNHQWIPSSSIQPENDPTILFTTAGMSQFRDIFTGDINCDHPFANLKRACSYQKCIRTGGKHDDLKEVGYDYRHHTFFEMLGNWSFGDYFKEEACKMALDLLVNEFKIPKDRLVITFFGGDSELGIPCDEETREIWLALGFQKDKVIPLGKSENFWEMGYVGPCGICSEIHYLMDGNCHQDPSKLLHNSLEIWNLVFMQYNRLKDGSLTPLSKNHVDTGMGLERINSVLNNVPSNYDTDGFIPLMELLQRETKAPPYRGSLTDPMDIAYRIVTDHIRMITVSLSDGLVPASRDAGYQFRRIFRRCYFHLVDEFRTKQPADLIATLCKRFADLIGDDYPEISQNIENVCKTVKRESLLVNFLRKKTYQKFQELANDKKLQQKNFINGQETFSLFMEGAGSKWLLNRLAKQMDMVIDWEGFEKLFEEHKMKSAEGLEKVKNT